MYKNMRKRSNILLHCVVHAVDQGKDAHQPKSIVYVVFVNTMLFISMNNSVESWDRQDNVLGRVSPRK